MKIKILIKNVGRDFIPAQKELQNLFVVANHYYFCPVEIIFETSQSFSVSPEGVIASVQPLEILVTEDLTSGPRTFRRTDYFGPAEMLNKSIQKLLLATNSRELNLPATVKIEVAGKSFHYRGKELVDTPEWR